jgi:hypothetical protein
MEPCPTGACSRQSKRSLPVKGFKIVRRDDPGHLASSHRLSAFPRDKMQVFCRNRLEFNSLDDLNIIRRAYLCVDFFSGCFTERHIDDVRYASRGGPACCT